MPAGIRSRSSPRSGSFVACMAVVSMVRRTAGWTWYRVRRLRELTPVRSRPQWVKLRCMLARLPGTLRDLPFGASAAPASTFERCQVEPGQGWKRRCSAAGRARELDPPFPLRSSRRKWQPSFGSRRQLRLWQRSCGRIQGLEALDSQRGCRPRLYRIRVGSGYGCGVCRCGPKLRDQQPTATLVARLTGAGATFGGSRR